MRGRVLSGTGGVWRVYTDADNTIDASLRGRLKQDENGLKLAVGDEVVLEPDDRGTAWSIIEILPRKSRLARRAPGGQYGERVLAVNVDQVIIVFAAAKPEPHPRMLDRFLVIAEGNDLPARVVVNKAELVEDVTLRAPFAVYERAGYDVHYTSVKTNRGLDELRLALDGRVSVLTGPSGVGKSSLLNTLYPGLNLRVGEISESVNKGRHTTVGASLHPLPGGSFVVDTPGLREVGMWAQPSDELEQCFREFRQFLGNCRFGDCQHESEPGCAILEAVKRGDITTVRFESFLKLRGELAAAEQR